MHLTPATLETDQFRAVLLPGFGTEGGYSLLVDETTQSHVNPDDPEDLQLPYVRTIAAIIDALFPPDTTVSALHLGAGALTLPRFVAHTRPGSSQRVVELHGELLDFVLDAIPVNDPSGVEFVVADAVAYVETLTDETVRFDLVVVDVYTGSDAPDAVAASQFHTALRAALAPGGIVVVNAFTASGPDLARDVEDALREVHEHVIAIADADLLSGTRIGNIVFAATDHEPDVDALAVALTARGSLVAPDPRD